MRLTILKSFIQSLKSDKLCASSQNMFSYESQDLKLSEATAQ